MYDANNARKYLMARLLEKYISCRPEDSRMAFSNVIKQRARTFGLVVAEVRSAVVCGGFEVGDGALQGAVAALDVADEGTGLAQDGTAQ
jgi:phosphoribosylformylglycinamidine (FGAM) synthase-like amidotransferase family enzyme